MMPFFLDHLGETRYGIWLLIASVFRYRNVLSMGLNSSVNRYIPMFLAKNDNEQVSRVVSTSSFYYLILCSVIVLCSLLLYWKVDDWFAIEPNLVETAKRLALLTGICLAAATGMQCFSAVLSGLQRYDLVNIAVLVPILIRTILLIWLLSHGCGLIGMGLLFGLSEIGIRLLHLYWARKHLSMFSLSLRHVDFGLLKEMVWYGVNTILYATGALVIAKASDIIIGIYFGMAEVSQFAVAIAGVLMLSQFLQAFSRAIMPAISDLDAREDHSKIRNIALLTQKYSLLLIIPAGAFFVVLGKEFLQLWIGGKFENPTAVDTLYSVLVILTVGHCLRLAQHSNYLVLVGRGQHRVFGVWTAIMAVSCVILSVIGIEVFDAKLVGIAWAHFIPLATISSICLPIYFLWKMQMGVLLCVREVWVPAIKGTSPCVLLLLGYKHFISVDSWASIVLVIVLVAAITFISSWVFSFSEIERERFVRLLPSLKRSASGREE